MVINIKTKDLSKVLVMTNTSDTHFIAERSGKIYRTPFRGEGTVSRIDKNDLIMFQDTVTDEVGSNKIVSINYGDFLMPIIDPENYPIYKKQIEQDADGYSVIPLERGAIDPEDGDWLDYNPMNPYLRSAVYIPIEKGVKYKFRCESGEIYSIRIMLCDREQRIIHDKWFNGIANYQTVMVNMTFDTLLEDAHYLMFDIRGAGNPSVKFEINAPIGLQTEHVTIKEFMFADNYNFITEDTLEAVDKQMEINHEGSRTKITTLALRAPSYRPLDVKLRLLNSGYKTHQYVDLRSVRDNEDDNETRGRMEIGIRSFSIDTPVPQFCVGFADTINGTLINRFIVDPDAMMVHLTKDGVQFRTSNVSNNNPGAKELYTINFKSLSEKVDKCYTSLMRYNMIIDQVTPEGLEMVNITADHIDYNNELYPNVQAALDILMSYNTKIETDDIHNQLDDLYNIVSGLDTDMRLVDLATAKKISDLSTIVATYNDGIQRAEMMATGAKAAVDAIPDYYGDINAVSDRVSSLESFKTDHLLDYNALDNKVIGLNNDLVNLTSTVSNMDIDFTSRFTDLDAQIDNILKSINRLAEKDINLDSVSSTNSGAIATIMNDIKTLKASIENTNTDVSNIITSMNAILTEQDTYIKTLQDEMAEVQDFVDTIGSQAIRDIVIYNNSTVVGVEQFISSLGTVDFTTERDGATVTVNLVMNPYSPIMIFDAIQFEYSIRLDDKEVATYTSMFQMTSTLISISVPVSVANKGEHKIGITGMLRSDGYIEFNPGALTMSLDIFEPAVKAAVKEEEPTD